MRDSVSRSHASQQPGVSDGVLFAWHSSAGLGHERRQRTADTAYLACFDVRRCTLLIWIRETITALTCVQTNSQSSLKG